MIEALLAGGLSLVGGWGGAYFGAYLRQKGENLATHEDINKLVDQVRAVTQATKEIESKISNDVWDRQKRWEIKRDAVFEMVREMGSLEVALGDFISVYRASQGEEQSEFYKRKKIEESQKYQQAQGSYERAKTVAILVCSEKIKQASSDFGVARTQLTSDIVHNSMEKANKDFGAVIREGLKLERSAPARTSGRVYLIGIAPFLKLLPARIPRLSC